ncbi:MAG TPA: hypothetical protein VG496_15075 [Myxococcales bacterium]|nr:hypothetical protein [Myxococcales bacterium]
MMNLSTGRIVDRLVEAAVVRAVAARHSTPRTAAAGTALLSAMGAFFPLTTAKVLARESRLLPPPKS